MIDLLYAFFFWPAVIGLGTLALVAAVRCPARRHKPWVIQPYGDTWMRGDDLYLIGAADK